MTASAASGSYRALWKLALLVGFSLAYLFMFVPWCVTWGAQVAFDIWVALTPSLGVFYAGVVGEAAAGAVLICPVVALLAALKLNQLHRDKNTGSTASTPAAGTK